MDEEIAVCCRSDSRTEYIRNIIRNINEIEDELNKAKNAIDNSDTKGDSIEKIRTYEGISKLKYHLQELKNTTLWTIRTVKLLEKELIEMEIYEGKYK